MRWQDGKVTSGELRRSFLRQEPLGERENPYPGYALATHPDAPRDVKPHPTQATVVLEGEECEKSAPERIMCVNPST